MALYAKFISVTDEGDKVIGKVYLKEKKVVAETENEYIKEIMAGEIVDAKGHLLTADSGMDFLVNLPHNYRGSRFYAVLDDDDDPPDPSELTEDEEDEDAEN
jgi:hypothetical protein